MADISSCPVKPKNIYIIGAQSSGKTTLISALTAYFDNVCNLTFRDSVIQRPHILGEVARQVLKDRNITGLDVSKSEPCALEIQNLILDAQYEAETTAEGSWFISDRSGVDAIVYGICYAGKSGAEKLLNTSAWRALEKTLRKSLIVVCEPVVSWLKEDGLRLMPKDPLARYELVRTIHQEFCNFLNVTGLPYALLPNTRLELSERARFVISEWENS